MKNHLLLIGLFYSHALLSHAGEIELNDRMALIKKTEDEVLREKIISGFGDLNKYMFIWIHPERVFEVSAILKIKEGDKISYNILYWPENVRKEKITKTKLSEAEAKPLIDSIIHVFNIAKEPIEDNKDQEFPDRILMYKNFQNPDGVHWSSISIRGNSTNVDFKKILDALSPKWHE